MASKLCNVSKINDNNKAWDQNTNNVRTKHKNFGKILICSEKIIVSFRKLRDVREKFLICPAKFSYACRKVFDMSFDLTFFGMSGKTFLVISPPPSPTFLGRNINVQFVCLSRQTIQCPPPTNKIRPIRPCWKLFARIIFRGVLKFAPPALREF
jgi:hypothetical protein